MTVEVLQELILGLQVSFSEGRLCRYQICEWRGPAAPQRVTVRVCGDEAQGTLPVCGALPGLSLACSSSPFGSCFDGYSSRPAVLRSGNALACLSPMAHTLFFDGNALFVLTNVCYHASPGLPIYRKPGLPHNLDICLRVKEFAF